MEGITQAVVLAAGRGERLYPLTAKRPKVMLCVANKPILEYVIDALSSSGIIDVIIIVGYYSEKVQEYFGSGADFGVSIRYLKQNSQLGTSHALSVASELLEDHFLVVPGDNIINAGILSHIETTSNNAALLVSNAMGSKYGVALIENERIVRIVEKPEGVGTGLVSTGIYKFSNQIIPYILDELDLPSAINRFIADGFEVTAARGHGIWSDAIDASDLISINAEISNTIEPRVAGTIEEGAYISGNVSVGTNTVVRSGCYLIGPVVIGDGCEIGPHSVLMPYSSLGHQVTIEAFGVVKNSIIGDSVQIKSHSSISDSVILHGCSFGSFFHVAAGLNNTPIESNQRNVNLGAIIGESVSVGSHVTIDPGCEIGPDTRIGSNNIVRHNLPGNSSIL
jgi:glucose-1-phosphate thymidylyltransferase